MLSSLRHMAAWHSNRCLSALEAKDIGLSQRAGDVSQSEGLMLRQLARGLTKESTMDEHTCTPMFGFWLRNFTCFSRSPLVRASDRIEAGAKLMALVFAVLMIAPAAAFGTSVYDEQRQLAARQAVDWHTVAATAVDKSAVIARVAAVRFRSHVRWLDDGSVHSAWFVGPQDLKPGDQTSVWVDHRGDYVGPPTSRGQMSAAAFGAVALVWLGVTGGLYLVVQAVRWLIDRKRYAGWAVEWQEFDRDGGERQDRFRK